MTKHYAIVGAWGFQRVALGITVFEYLPETGDMKLLHRYDESICAGCQAYDKKRNILYVTDECENREGQRGGGGYVRAYRLDPKDGSLTMFSEQQTILTMPAYLWLDPLGEYCLVACHTRRNFVSKAVHDAQGHWIPCVLYDDAGVVLIRLNPDGSFGEVCDIAFHEGLTKNDKQVHAHPHSVMCSPDGNIYFVCDKGLDRIYSYKLDRENGKLMGMIQTPMDYGSAPRYGAFHPSLPVWYENNETSSWIYAFGYDSRTGELQKLSAETLYADDEVFGMQSDLVVHPSGRYLYAATRGVNEISILDINQQTGAFFLRGKVPNEGTPRGLAIAPDGKFLFCANFDTSIINVYAIGDDGCLNNTGRQIEAPGAANIELLDVEV